MGASFRVKYLHWQVSALWKTSFQNTVYLALA